MRRFHIWSFLLLSAAAMLSCFPAQIVAQPSSAAWCQNPSGAWIPVLGAATGTIFPGTPPATSLYASSNGGSAWYPLQCDASGNLTPSGGPYLPLAGGTLTGATGGAPIPGGLNATQLEVNGVAVGAGVTSIATTGPITGGTITGSGTIACGTCLTATSPSAGLASFSGGGQGMGAATAAQVGTVINLAQYDVLLSGGTSSAVVGVAPSSTSGLPLLSQGASSNPAYAALALSALATQGADTFLANATAGTAAPTAVAMPTTNHGVWLAQGTAAAPVATAAGTSGQVFVSAGSSTNPGYIDFPERFYIPAGNCNNATAGPGWSIGSGGTVVCRAGTNNLGGAIQITDTSSTFAQFTVMIPEDWDTATNPYIRFYVSAVTDTTNGHTIIPQIKVSCPTAGNGTTSDDASFSAAQSSSTITLGASAVANGFYNGSNVQIGSTQMTGCIAGGMMIVQVGRATDTATGNINFWGADLTFPRLIVVQAN